MADRYWVGGTANWDATAGTKWALTSGGAGGQAVPTAADDVYIDAGSGAVTVTIAASATCRNLSFTSGAGNFSGTFAGSAAQPIAVSGSLTLSSAMTLTYAGTMTFNSTTSQTITSNGKALSGSVTFDGVGGSWALQDNMAIPSANRVTLTNGTINLNGKNCACGNFLSSNSNVRTIAFGAGGSFTCSQNTGGNIWSCATSTNLTTTGTNKVVNISYSGSVASTIAPGALSEADAISFNVTAGTYALTATTNYMDLNFTGFSGSLVSSSRTIYGNLTFSSGMTIAASASNTAFASTSVTERTITTNGITLDMPLQFNGAGGSWRLVDNLTQGSTRLLSLLAGTLNINGKTATIGTFSSTGTTSRSMSFGTSGSVVVVGSGASAWTASGSGLTTTGTTSTVSMTSASAKTFAGGGFNYAATLDQGGAGALTISGNNTFANITNTYGATGATTITFTAGTTQTVSAFTASGTSGKILTLNSSSAGTRFNLSDSSGSVNVSFCSIRDSNATGGARWNSYLSNGNINAGNNLGWDFSQRGGLSPVPGLSGANGLSIGVGLVGNL